MKHLKMSMMLLLTVAIFTSCEKETIDLAENSLTKEQLSSRPINEIDSDGDGVLDENDPYPNSNMSETISITDCYPNVNNVIVRNGTTMMDQIDALIAEINSQYNANGSNYDYLHRKFIMLLERKVTDWRRNRLVNNTQRDAILRCAGSASIPALYKIGDLYKGGIVFYVDGTGQHGLVCALSDYGSLVEWGCYGTDLPSVPNVFSFPASGLGAEIGDGENNTNKILSIGNCPSSPAASAARSLGTEWFLPSINELDEMYKNKATLEAVSGFTPFANYYYWSSTEYGLGSAWEQNFVNGIQSNFNNKNYPDDVRAVRAF